MSKRKGVKIEDIEPGHGPPAQRGMTVEVRYDGYLNRGDQFQAEIRHTIRIGQRESIAGLEYGIVGMRVGGRRKIRVSPHLAYKSQGVPGIIPANAVLIFDVELLAILDDK